MFPKHIQFPLIFRLKQYTGDAFSEVNYTTELTGHILGHSIVFMGAIWEHGVAYWILWDHHSWAGHLHPLATAEMANGRATNALEEMASRI